MHGAHGCTLLVITLSLQLFMTISHVCNFILNVAFFNVLAHLFTLVMTRTLNRLSHLSSLFQHANMTLPMGEATATALADPAGWDYVMLQDQSETAGGGCNTDDHLAPHEVCTRSAFLTILARILHSSLTSALTTSPLHANTLPCAHVWWNMYRM